MVKDPFRRATVKTIKILAVVVVGLVMIFLSLGLFVPAVNYSASITINGSPEKCWNTFHDVAQMGQWIEGLESFKQIRGDSLVPGAVYEMVILQDERMVMQEEVKEVIKPARVAYELNNDVLKSEYSFDFIDKHAQTQINGTYKVTGNNLIWKSVFVLFRSTFSKGSQQQLEAVKKLVESTPSP